MDIGRVVETYVPSAEKRGSGFLVTGRLILTAAHCVPVDIGAEVKIRPLKGSDWIIGLLRWSGKDEGIDAALVELGSTYNAGVESAVQFGTPIGAVEWQSVGFPRFDSEGNTTEAESARGKLDPITKSRINPRTGRRELYALDSGIYVRAVPATSNSLWAGMSGAAVIVENHVIAVLVEEDTQVGARLLGVPIDWVLSNSEAARWLNTGGRPIRPEPLWGETHLLERPVRPLDIGRDDPAPVSRAVMLQARRRAVERVGRDAELQSLLEWSGDAGARPVRLVTGDAGAGKTRLGVEVCVALAQQGWICGFVAPNAVGFGRLLELEANRLLIVDDALRHLDQLRGLLKDADNADHSENRGRDTWRILVLARPPYDRWWRGFENEFASMIEDDVLRLPPPSIAERVRLYEAARQQFNPWVKANRQASELPALDDPVFESYLAILERALLESDPKGRLSGDANQELAARLLHLEAETYWLPEAKAAGLDCDPELLERIVAVCSMAFADGSTANEREAAAARCLRVLPDLADAPERTVRQIARWQRGLYETGEGYLRPLRPHLLATEAAKRLAISSPDVISELLNFPDTAPGNEQQRRLGLELAVAQATRVLSTLLPAVRGATGIPADPAVAKVLEKISASRLDAMVVLAIEHAEAVPTESTAGKALSLEALLAELLRLIPSPRRAAAVVREVPLSRNLKLDDLAVVLQTQAVTAYRNEVDSANERLADALENLSVRQHDIRALEDARNSAQQSVDLRAELLEGYTQRHDLSEEERRQLANKQAQAQVKISSSRARLANLFCDLDLRIQAVEEATKARELLSRVDGSAEVFDLHRHVSLEVISNLSRALRRAGQRTAACELSNEAERLAEDLFNYDPQKYHHWYAIALRRHSAALSDLGNVNSAVQKAEEAVKHFDVMTRRDPHRWAYDAAKAHRNLAERLGDTGRWRDADREANHAVHLWRALVSRRASVYNLELTKAVVMVARAKLRLGELEQAEQAVREIDYRIEPRNDGERDTVALALAASAEVLLASDATAAAHLASRSLQLVQQQSASFGQLKVAHLALAHFVLAACTITTDPASASRHANEAELLCSELRAQDPTELPAVLRDVRQRWIQLSST